MKVEFRASFLKDLKKLQEASTKKKVRELITLIESTERIQDISNLKKLKGGESFYRIRLGGLSSGVGGRKRKDRLCSISASKRYLPIFPIIRSIAILRGFLV